MTEMDLCGELCPFPVVKVIQAVENMKTGETKVFHVDDPLAIKSIPEELEEHDSLDFNIEKKGLFWKLVVNKK